MMRMRMMMMMIRLRLEPFSGPDRESVVPVFRMILVNQKIVYDALRIRALKQIGFGSGPDPCEGVGSDPCHGEPKDS